MTNLRVGTRGSELALEQTRSVVAQLRKLEPSLVIEEVIIKTHGDDAAEKRIEADWPVGGFVSAIESALLDGVVDFAVHSCKDLPTSPTLGLTIAAIPLREVAHDLLVSHVAVTLNSIPPGFRVGTGSPRRAAQLRQIAAVEIIPIRGNVPTRLAKVDGAQLDAVVLAAAGLRRLGVRPPHCVELPVEAFPPAPAQGALAIQTKEDSPVYEMLRGIDHEPSRRAVNAERSFLRGVGGGCHRAVGALAKAGRKKITLRGQLFSEDGKHVVEGVEEGDDPAVVGEALAARLIRELQDAS